MNKEEKLILKELYSSSNANQRLLLEKLFPKLKEGEDERIRKEIISFLKEGNPYHCPNSVKRQGWATWLEKQGEQKSVPVWMPKFLDELRLKKNYFDWDEHKDIEGNILAIIEWMKPNYFINGKDGGQKPVDNIEPKYKVGDWVILVVGELSTTLQIVKVDTSKKRYWFNDNSYLPIVNEECLHLWTIQDAKPGDVLVNQNGEMPFIFLTCEEHYVFCYCAYTNRKNIFFDKFIDENGCSLHWVNLLHEKVCPATKEQRDFFFQKMKEAGYEWDADNKKIEKIDIELTDFEKSLKHIMIETLECGDTHNLKADAEMLLRCVQKPTEWTEDDEHRVKDTIYFLESARKHYASTVEIDACIDWLKSLRLQSQWKPSQLLLNYGR